MKYEAKRKEPQSVTIADSDCSNASCWGPPYLDPFRGVGFVEFVGFVDFDVGSGPRIEVYVNGNEVFE